MFIDRVKIEAQGGDGGNGSVAFRREKGAPRGGPSGGDGGAGGSVILKAERRLRTLLDFSFRPILKSKRGQHGKGSNHTGSNGEDGLYPVPCGTRIFDNEGSLLCDLVDEGQTFVAARGGRGGKGNNRFATATRQAPRMAEKGQPGEARALVLELVLLADVGLVGFPNAGKSTLLSRLSASRPKIGSYPFTTLAPSLGVVRWNDEASFVLADLPGLIEGAHSGRGLGDAFLRHVSRCAALVFLVDLLDPERNPADALELLMKEICLYDETLAKRSRLVVLSKVDAADSVEADRVAQQIRAKGEEVLVISAHSGDGLDKLLTRLGRLVEEQENSDIRQPSEPVQYYRSRPRFHVSRKGNAYVVTGDEVKKWVAMTDFQNEGAVERFGKIIRLMGVEKALRSAGAQTGELVMVEGKEMRLW